MGINRSILYLQYTNPANYPPLEHSGLILLQAGWPVNYFGIQSEGASSRLAFPAALSGRVTLWRRQSPGVRQKLHYIAFTLACLWRAFWQRPAWVYCSDLMSCPAAWLIGRLTLCKVLYHEHDSPQTESREQKAESRNEKIEEGETRRRDDGTMRRLDGSLPPEVRSQSSVVARPPSGRSLISDLRSPSSAFHRLLLWTRRLVGREAALVVLPNQKRLDLFAQATGRQRTSFCVFNCPRKEEGTPQKLETRPQGMLRLMFVGSINGNRLPMAVLEAMSRFPGRVELSVVGYETVGAKGYMAEFLRKAPGLGLGKAVEFVGALPTRRDLFEQASKSDVGLAFMPMQGGDINMVNMAGASNKPFDYLACGLALLVSDLPDWKQMFVDPGYGLACQPDDEDSIAAQLRWFLEHPAETRAMGERGRQRILTEWNYESQFAPVVQKLNESVLI